MRWFRIDSATGLIVGETAMAEALALANLADGQRLVPWQAGISHKLHRWSEEAGGFVPRSPEADPGDDYAFMRRTGYPSAGDQLGVVLKVLGHLWEAGQLELPPEVADELAGQLAAIAAVKAAHPKPDR